MDDDHEVPCVEFLDYRVKCAPHHPDAWEPAKLTHQDLALGAFRCSVSGGTLRATPTRRFAAEREARSELDPLLRRWEAVIGITQAFPFRFELEHSMIVTAPPDGSGPPVRELTRGTPFSITIPVAFAVLPAQLPEPHEAFAEPDDLRLLRDRIQDYRRGSDRLLVLAYFAHTTFTTRYGGGKETGRQMNVDSTVLKTLKDLSSDRRSDRHGRKALNLQELTKPEETWVEAAVIKLALHMGQLEGGASPPLLTMSDLPPLPLDSATDP